MKRVKITILSTKGNQKKKKRKTRVRFNFAVNTCSYMDVV